MVVRPMRERFPAVWRLPVVAPSKRRRAPEVEPRETLPAKEGLPEKVAGSSTTRLPPTDPEGILRVPREAMSLPVKADLGPVRLTVPLASVLLAKLISRSLEPEMVPEMVPEALL